MGRDKTETAWPRPPQSLAPLDGVAHGGYDQRSAVTRSDVVAA